MSETFLETPTGRRLAYNLSEGSGPGVVFLGGFASDKEGSKALFLEDYCRKRGRAYLRFDYSGHGTSSGAFTDGAIGDWAEDAYAALSALTQGPQVIVGSSMGGWISLLLAKRCP
ncbi:MAG: alpha/beta hydrolase, partial [Pseudomonadota bacterium]